MSCLGICHEDARGPTDHARQVVGTVVKMFAQTDRAIRMGLLDNLASFIDHMTPKMIAQNVFPQVVRFAAGCDEQSGATSRSRSHAQESDAAGERAPLISVRASPTECPRCARPPSKQWAWSVPRYHYAPAGRSRAHVPPIHCVVAAGVNTCRAPHVQLGGREMEDLLRQFARTQLDEVPGIRTNTTICLGRLAEHLDAAVRRACGHGHGLGALLRLVMHLTPARIRPRACRTGGHHAQAKKRVLIAAFTRALRDPFPPARIAGLAALQGVGRRAVTRMARTVGVRNCALMPRCDVVHPVCAAASHQGHARCG